MVIIIEAKRRFNIEKMVLLCFLIAISLSSYAQTKKVLLIGIDGCRPDAVSAAATPNLDVLMANGTFTLDALNTGVTSSGPGWSSLLTGVWPEKHGVVDNSFSGSDFTNYPHLFKRIEEYDSSLETVSIVQWHPINDQIAAPEADITVNVSDHTDFVVTEANVHLGTGDPDVIFLHFDDVDHAGHSFGFSPSVTQYISAIETVDTGIGQILNTLTNRPNYASEDWAIIVSTDHGGLGTSHGGNSIEERNIFMIVSGDEITNQEIVAEEILTEIPPVVNCLNDSVELAFDGSSYVSIDADPSFDFGSNEDFTVECWVRTTESGDVAIVTDKDWDSGVLPGWVFSFNAGGGPWKVNVGDGNDRVDIEGGEISDGEWHMLSATFDRDGMLSIYEDGTLVGQESMTAIGGISTGFPLRFGADSESDYGFTGNLSEVRIFSGIVSPSSISDWSCSSLESNHPDYSNLVGVWKMNEGVGNTISDLGANNLEGLNNGGDWQSSQDTIFILEKDYSNTPRQVDFMVSALEHLCVPIDPLWNLDGNILGTLCSTSVVCDPCITLDLNILLQGPYDEVSGLMTDNLRIDPSFSLNEPYSEIYGTNNNEQITDQTILDLSGNDAIVDWIYVEMRDGSNPSFIIETQSALIQRDGDIVSAMDGVSMLMFQDPSLSYNDIVVAIRHRNHFGVRNVNPIVVTGGSNIFSIDFSSIGVPILGGNNAMYTNGGLRFMIAGDANNDGTINSIDLNAHWRIENGQSYNYVTIKSDFNLDGFVNSVDKNLSWRPNNGLSDFLD
ncbi:MAG: hypothetical protein ACI8U0_001815 [Flavobacteriales bacterium]|jgi:hypothetical protein